MRRRVLREEAPRGERRIASRVKREDLCRLSECAKGSLERRQRRGVGDVGHLRAQRTERTPERGGAGRAIGLRQARPDREAGGQEHALGPPERTRGLCRGVRDEESRDAPAARVEGKERIDHCLTGEARPTGSEALRARPTPRRAAAARRPLRERTRRLAWRRLSAAGKAAAPRRSWRWRTDLPSRRPR